MRTTIKILAMFAGVAGLLLASQAAGSAQVWPGLFGGKTVKASKVFVTKEINVPDFSGISVSGSPDVIYVQKPGKPEVVVNGPDNIVDLLDICVENGSLNVRFRKGVSVSYDKLEIRVSSERINRINVSGSADVELGSYIRTDRMDMSISGSGDIKGDRIDCSGDFSMRISGSGDAVLLGVRSRAMEMSVSGSGDAHLGRVSVSGKTGISVTGSGTVSIEGNTDKAEFRVSGSGDIFAGNCQAREVSATVSGSGNIECNAIEFLKVRTSGSGDVAYRGNPRIDYPRKGLRRL